MHRKRKTLGYFFIITIAVISIFGAVLRCAQLIQNHYLEQAEQVLKDVACQDARALQNQMQERYDLLKSMTYHLDQNPEDRDKGLQDFQTIVESYGLRRIGYCSADGMSHTLDTASENLSYREFFVKGMQGEAYISGVLQDALNEKHENVTIMSMPMHDKNGNIDGVACITYDTDSFGEALPTQNFDGHGYSYVISQEGEIIVSFDKELLKISDNLFTDVLKKNYQNKAVESELFLGMHQKKECSGTFWLGETAYYYHFSPVFLMDDNVVWYVFSVVPTEFLQGRFYFVKRNLTRMIIIVMLTWLVGALIIRQFSVSQRKMAYRLAFESPVTQGPNLVRYFEWVKTRKNRTGYVVCLEIENFTHMSVAAGKENSDWLLNLLWECIEKTLYPDEFACHDKADQFVMFMRNHKEEELLDRLKTLRDTIHEEALKGQFPWVNVKYGICHLENCNNAEDAYGKARLAIRGALGSDTDWSFFDDEKHLKQLKNQELEERFDDALLSEEFEVWYQPKYSAKNETLTGCEALVRWRDHDNTLISPGIFIPMLEKNGKIARLDEYVFTKVCEQQKEWKKDGKRIVPVSVNVSRATLYRTDILEGYCRILDENGIDYTDVQLEVTETAVAQNLNISELLGKFRERGIKILMDDFGTGYSSLSTLNMQCFDTLKLDKSLVDNVKNSYGEKLLYHTIKMAQDLGLYTTAEGVEEQIQLKFLRESGCDDIQGYYFSKPLPAKEYVKHLS